MLFSWILSLWPEADMNQIVEISFRDLQLPPRPIGHHTPPPGIYKS